ncbi:TetR/AcrR family transcriptional regulator [Nocardioides sp. CER19]|uniref:TetR/AcrR family transcriptional regulator n=1 Tax=Nocardioides sp. CER19 TaxID=3038538 RepID=UPI00244A2429|nr:TetR/AcrR family transcriptional regulator [Nocardioides sp. CER19]MDH2413296.1 TetR/AcrR family transcriptional regulator [Nocardioides sp. CER19]
MRADAKRNYDKIVEVAGLTFREKGYDAPLDEIAKRAGVGPGTLYRHFPTREALIDAVMQNWIASVHESADKALAHEGDARDRLMAWFEEYAARLTVHKGVAAKITAALGDERSPMANKCQTYAAANEKVVEALRAEGAVRPQVEPLEVLRLIGGIATVADQGNLSPEAVRPMLAVVADGVLR